MPRHKSRESGSLIRFNLNSEELLHPIRRDGSQNPLFSTQLGKQEDDPNAEWKLL